MEISWEPTIIIPMRIFSRDTGDISYKAGLYGYMSVVGQMILIIWSILSGCIHSEQVHKDNRLTRVFLKNGSCVYAQCYSLNVLRIM